ncbi:hypothetical protein HDU96_008014 [Phlyctochytrium bullatum]|nr:hypothetical protein HDU96_008014 [Phlyctochytrium bullatum]
MGILGRFSTSVWCGGLTLAPAGILTLSEAKLKELPVSIFSIKTLRSLDISLNRLDTLPVTIAKWSDTLKILNLAGNLFSTLPEEVYKFHRLESLNLSNNALLRLGPGVAAFKKLKTLNLSGNRLKELPAEIGSLPSLVTLDISRNAITALPTTLSTLTSLEELDAESNQLTTVPAELGSAPSLKILRLKRNQISTFPSEVLKNPTVAWIEFEENPITSDRFREIDGYEEAMVDIGSYSKFTAKVAEMGKVSSEIVTESVGRYLNQIIDIIYTYGGDIVKFLAEWDEAHAIMDNCKRYCDLRGIKHEAFAAVFVKAQVSALCGDFEAGYRQLLSWVEIAPKVDPLYAAAAPMRVAL